MRKLIFPICKTNYENYLDRLSVATVVSFTKMIFKTGAVI